MSLGDRSAAGECSSLRHERLLWISLERGPNPFAGMAPMEGPAAKDFYH